MPVNKRQQICDAVDTGLKSILKENGYETDLGNHIYEWREEPVPEKDMPAAIWRDTDEPVDLTMGQHVHTLNMGIELLAKGEDAPEQLRTLIADVVKMIGLNLTWGEIAEDTQPQTESIRTERESKRIAGATVTFQILYTTERFNAYV